MNIPKRLFEFGEKIIDLEKIVYVKNETNSGMNAGTTIVFINSAITIPPSNDIRRFKKAWFEYISLKENKE